MARAATADHGARVIESTGEGMVVGFTSPDAGLSGAVAIQQAVERRNRTGDQRLETRIGLSVGDAVIDNGELQGRAVVEAARLCAAAKPRGHPVPGGGA